MASPTAKVRTILGDAPNTLEEDRPVEVVPVDVPGVIIVAVPAIGHVFFRLPSEVPPREAGALLDNNGRQSERPLRIEGGTATIPVITNGAGQDRLVVIVEGWNGA